MRESLLGVRALVRDASPISAHTGQPLVLSGDHNLTSSVLLRARDGRPVLRSDELGAGYPLVACLASLCRGPASAGC
ncbi:MAG: hypothetical protein ACRDS0_21815 [Pseudonocardiaceae bacterium]